MRYLLICCLSILTCSIQMEGQSLKSTVEKLKKDPDLKHANWSVYVMNVQKDSCIFDYNGTASLVPASTLKILTTGAALITLGSDYKFKTSLEYDGTIDTTTGILHGNLYIVGGGDPSLGSAYFQEKKDSTTLVEKLAIRLKEKGIRKIDGAIIGDAGIFEDNMVPPQWIWADMGNYFGAGASGLSYADNKFTLHLHSGASGSSVDILKTVPPIEGLNIINELKSGGKDDNAFLFGSPYTYDRFLQGTIPANQADYEVEGSIPEPALYCAQALKKALQDQGIESTEIASTVRLQKRNKEYAEAKRRPLLVNDSPSLEKIVYWTNLKSINLYAEHLLKFLSYKQTGLGTEIDGTTLLGNFWKNKGVDTDGMFLNDGCGLSRANVITTRTEAMVLQKMSREKTFNAFYNSLPVAGKSGSLGNICEGTCAENNLRAKSGYITRARGYAGYVKNKKGELLCFSILANNYTCSPSEMKRKLEQVMVAIASME